MGVVEDLAASYADSGEQVTPAVGETFNAIVSHEGDAAFDHVAVGRVSLRYPIHGAPELIEGNVVSVRGVQMKLAEDPQPIGDGYEQTVPLHKV